MEQGTAINQAPTNEVQTTPKQSNFLVTLLSILLLISCLIAGFFAYQTQKLVKELTIYRLQPTEAPVPTPTPYPTADWKTYENIKYGYTVKYPPLLVPVETINDSYLSFLNFEGDTTPETFSIYVRKSNLDNEIETIRAQTEGHILTTLTKTDYIKINGYDAIKLEYSPDQPEIGPKTTTVAVNNGKYSYVINTNTEYHDLVLSTFKFIEPEASSSPLGVACTMEAKICPDGSAVGRSGPKCEFSPCPTPKP